MKISSEFEDKYVKEFLHNTSLKNLPDEEWKPIENFEEYEISNYGRIKSLERWIMDSRGRKRKVPEHMMKLQFMKFFNKYLNHHFYNITCLLSSEGKRSRKSVPRLVYYHFVEKPDVHEKPHLISFKDNNRFNIHAKNLEKLSVSQERFKRVQTDRVRNHKDIYEKTINQYTVDGNLIETFENIKAAGERLSISYRNIFAVINKERLTAGGFRWFLKEYVPTDKDFVLAQDTTTNKILNTSLWKRLGQPSIDNNNPPACMNLSLENLPDENWKPLPGLSNQFAISNKGRIKRLNCWTSTKNKRFINEKIISLFLENYADTSYLYTNLSYKGKRIQIRLNKLLYYCFVKQFDLNDRSLVIINKNKPAWDIDISKLKLSSSAYHLNKK